MARWTADDHVHTGETLLKVVQIRFTQIGQHADRAGNICLKSFESGRRIIDATEDAVSGLSKTFGQASSAAEQIKYSRRAILAWPVSRFSHSNQPLP